MMDKRHLRMIMLLCRFIRFYKDFCKFFRVFYVGFPLSPGKVLEMVTNGAHSWILCSDLGSIRKECW
jgi:hypothetical protein